MTQPPATRLAPARRAGTPTGEVGPDWTWDARSARALQGRAWPTASLSGAAPRVVRDGATGRSIQRAGTNLVPNPSLQVDTTGYSPGGSTVTRITGAAAVGSGFGRIEATAGSGAHGFSMSLAGALQLDVPAVVSCFVRRGNHDWVTLGEGGDGPWMRAYFNLASGAVGTLDGALAASIDDASGEHGAGWWRLQVTLMHESSTNAVIAFRLAGGENSGSFEAIGTEFVDLDGLQLEPVATFATGYTDGSRGDGFSWHGTAHASASMRTATDIAIRATGQTDVEGTWTASIRPHWSSDDAARRTLAHAPGGVWMGHEDGEYVIECPGRAGVERLVLPWIHSRFELVRLAVSWSPELLCLQVNGAVVSAKRQAKPLCVQSNWIQIGRSAMEAGDWIDADVRSVTAYAKPIFGSHALAQLV